MLLTLDAHQITILLYIIDFRRPPNNNITLLLNLDAHQVTILLYVIGFIRLPNNNITLYY